MDLSFEHVSGVASNSFSKNFPIIRHGFYSSIVDLAIFYIILQVLLPVFLRRNGRHRQPDYLKPVMLIWSGLLFGINGAGFMVTLSLTSWGRDTFSCRLTNPSNQDPFLSGVINYSGIAYFIIKHLDFGRLLFNQLRGRDNHYNDMFFIQTSLIILLVQSGVYYYPGGVFTFIALLDTLVGCFTNSYYILSAADYFRQRQSWKKRTIIIQLAGYVVLFLYGIFATTGNVVRYRKLLFGRVRDVQQTIEYERMKNGQTKKMY